jgi:hypothetical protein
MRKCEYEGQIDRYLMNKLSESEKIQFEEHYFNCPSCFQKTVECNELLETIKNKGASLFVPSPKEAHISLWEKVVSFLTPRQWIAAAVSAALLVVVVLGVVPRLKTHSPDFVFTGEETVRGESLVLVSPRGNLSAPPVYFEWKSFGENTEYLITLTLSGQEKLWSQTTPETKIAIPEDIKNKLKASGIYSWQVKAYSPQGTMLASSPKVTFKISK